MSKPKIFTDVDEIKSGLDNKADKSVFDEHKAEKATSEKLGHVLPDSETIFITENGKLTTRDPSFDWYTFYDEGFENENVTGGWVDGLSRSNGEQLKELDHLYLKAFNSEGAAERTYVTDNPIPLNNINTLSILIEKTETAASAVSSSYLIVSSDKDGGYDIYDASLHMNSTFDKQVKTLDVSNLTGEYYIRIHAVDRGGSTLAESIIKVYSLWGE